MALGDFFDKNSAAGDTPAADGLIQNPENQQEGLTNEPEFTEGNLKEKSSGIILQHPFLKQDASSALYVKGEEVRLKIKEGIVSLKLNAEEHIRDILLKEGWIDKTEYALETKVPEPAKTFTRPVRWSFFHPNASSVDPINGNIAFKKRNGSEVQLEVKNNLITTNDEELADIMKAEKFSTGNVEYEKVGINE